MSLKSTTMPATLDDLLTELQLIRKALESRPAPPAQAPAGGHSGSRSDDPAIPQPTTVIANAGDVQIHFGKNQGVALGTLSERSLSWYATDQEAKLDRNGQPFRPRPQEITLKNAARTLWHQKRGTLVGGVASASSDRTPAADTAPAGATQDEDVPFGRRDLDHG